MPDPNDLCTLSDVEAWLSINGGTIPSTEQGVLSRAITSCSYLILGLMNRSTMLAVDYTETRSGRGGSIIVPYQRPVRSVASVTVDGTSIPAKTTPTGFGYIFDKHSIRLSGYTFNRGVGNVVLAYNAGFSTTVPTDIAQACIELVAQKYKRRQHTDQDSQVLAQQQINFSKTDIPREVRLLIDSNYKLRAMIE